MKSVLDYGAKGDGFTDDTQAIQAAFDSGDDVYFPYGNYRISTSLVFKDENLVVSGTLWQPRPDEQKSE